MCCTISYGVCWSILLENHTIPFIVKFSHPELNLSALTSSVCLRMCQRCGSNLRSQRVDIQAPRISTLSLKRPRGKQRVSPRFATREKYLACMRCFEKKQRHHHLMFLCGPRSCETLSSTQKLRRHPHISLCKTMTVCCSEEKAATPSSTVSMRTSKL